MAYRRKSYTYWDGDAIFPIPFEYLEQDDILVFINDEPTTDFVIENTQVKLNNIPTEVPAIIKIVSATDIDKAIVDWENVSSLDEDNLILSDNQIRYAVQELYDNTEQFKVDINNTLSEVNEAARLISTTIEAVDNAVTTTQEQATIATEQANIAIENTELVASTANKALEDIDTLRTNTINEFDTIVENSVETVSGLANEITHNAQNIINRLGINLFDTKVSDHVLEGEEALGWALQGTYVYKEGVAGSRTGYADFYERCVEEYNNSTLGESVTGAQWVQPVNPSGITTSGWQNVVNAFDDNSNTYTTINNVTDYIEWNLGEYLAVSGFTATGIWVDSVAAGTELTIYSVDEEGNEKLLGTSTGSSNNSSPYTLNCSFTPVVCNKLRFKATNGQERYPSRIAEIKITANQLMGIYTNPNGHKFYPISQKPYIDSIYESTGIADYYGIDLVNERIFLPRDKYFAVTGGVKGNGITLGLTNGSDNTGLLFSKTTVEHYSSNNNYYGEPVGTIPTGGTMPYTTLQSIGITTDPTKSGIELEPNTDKYLYYCVGNTKVESAITNVTEITTSENDTLPLFYNFYSKEDMTTTGAYVNASLGSWLSGNVYATAYNELVNKLGTDNVKSNTDTYTDYDFVVNQDNMTFRLPLKNGQEIMFATGVKGNGKTLGVTDGTNELGTFISNTGNGVGTFINNNGESVGTPASSISGANNIGRVVGVTTDSTKSGIVLDTENITIPDGWNLYYKVANAVTNLELLDVAKVTADLNTKLSRGNKEEIAGWGVPDYSATISNVGNNYTAPSDGIFWFSVVNSNSARGIYINGVLYDMVYNSYGTGGGYQVALSKGDTIIVTSADTALQNSYFIPLKGANQ